MTLAPTLQTLSPEPHTLSDDLYETSEMAQRAAVSAASATTTAERAQATAAALLEKFEKLRGDHEVSFSNSDPDTLPSFTRTLNPKP